MAKLKGKNSERIKSEQKEKMQTTLNTMIDNREKDSVRLRDLAEAKLKWAQQEREKRVENIKKLNENIKQLQLQVVKLDGVILAYEELLQSKEEKKEA